MTKVKAATICSRCGWPTTTKREAALEALGVTDEELQDGNDAIAILSTLKEVDDDELDAACIATGLRSLLAKLEDKADD